MKLSAKLISLMLCLAITAPAQGNLFKVRYNAGTLATKVDGDDWGNHLTVTSDSIKLTLKDGQSLTIPPNSVTGISYGQEAHRRVGTMVALAIIVSPVALFGLMHKTKLHFVGIEYSLPDGKKGGLLLQAHKDNYRGLLTALSGVTGKSVDQDMTADAEQIEKEQKSDKNWDKQPIGKTDQTATPPPSKIDASKTAKKCYENGHRVDCP